MGLFRKPPRNPYITVDDARSSSLGEAPLDTHVVQQDSTHELLVKVPNSEECKRKKSKLPSHSSSFTIDNILSNNQNTHQLKLDTVSLPLSLSPPSTPNYDSDTAPLSFEAQTLLPEPLCFVAQPSGKPARLAQLYTASNTPDLLDSPQEVCGDQELQTSLWVAILVLSISTGVAAGCTELAVDAIPAIVDDWGISHIFLGFVVLPFVGNAAEHVTAAKMALRNRMVLAKSVALESATQIVLFIMPAIVLLGWLRGRTMSLRFDLFEVACIAVTGVVISAVICRGKSGYKQGILLHTIYMIFAMGAVFYRGSEDENRKLA